MKLMMAACLLCAAGTAYGSTDDSYDANARNTALVVQGPSGLAVRVDGQLIQLNAPVVYEANGRRSNARLTPGMAVSFVLAPPGTLPRIKEVWTNK